MKTLRSN